MIAWTRHGEAVVGEALLRNGRKGRIALVGKRENPRGFAVLYASKDGGGPVTVLAPDAWALLDPGHLIAALCMQERCFGDGRLPGPPDTLG